MSETSEFSSKREFLGWVSKWAAKDCRLAIGYNAIANTVRAAVIDSARPDWAMIFVKAPVSNEEAKLIWDKIREDGLCLFFVFTAPMDSQVVIVSSRKCIWDSLQACFLSLDKRKFSELSWEDARAYINDEETWNAIAAEVQMFGISCRILFQYNQPSQP